MNIQQYYVAAVYEDGERWVAAGGCRVEGLNEYVEAYGWTLKSMKRKARIVIEPLVVDGVPWVGDWDEMSVRRARPEEVEYMREKGMIG